MWGTPARSDRWTRDSPELTLSSHPLLPSFSFLKLTHANYRRAPHPLGATWDGRGTNFALFSANAEKVELCLFDRHGRRELERIALPERTEDVWHGYLTMSRRGSSTAIASTGPTSPSAATASTPTSC